MKFDPSHRGPYRPPLYLDKPPRFGLTFGQAVGAIFTVGLIYLIVMLWFCL